MLSFKINKRNRIGLISIKRKIQIKEQDDIRTKIKIKIIIVIKTIVKIKFKSSLLLI